MVVILHGKIRTRVTRHMGSYARIVASIHLGRKYLHLVDKPCEVECIVKIFDSEREMESPRLNKTFCEAYEVDAGRFIQDEYGLEIGDILERYGQYKVLDLVLRRLFEKRYTAQQDGKVVDSNSKISGVWTVINGKILTALVDNDRTIILIIKM